MPNDRAPRAFDTLLAYLRHNRRFNFASYKRSTLMRRVQKRMQAIAIESFTEYLDYLQAEPQEISRLFDTILIKVTAFFRDAPAWRFLADALIPRLIADKPADELLRVWSAGCASGEEVYTLAMVLAEVLGEEEFRRRVKIFATDLDVTALAQARKACYAAENVRNIPAGLLAKYFEPRGEHYVFRKDLSGRLVFGRHNLATDVPISHIDLLVCRNTLMYFNADIQDNIIDHFYFSLTDNGYLFLGKADMLHAYTDCFTPVNMKQRIFTKVPPSDIRYRLAALAQRNDMAINLPSEQQARYWQAAYEVKPLAQIVMDVQGKLMLANAGARKFFGLTSQDIGRPIQDLPPTLQPTILLTYVEQVYTADRPLSLQNLEWPSRTGGVSTVHLEIVPLLDPAGSPLGVSISFTDVTSYVQMQTKLLHAQQELETVFEEMRSTNEELEATNEELQTANEELRVMQEDLATTNEELQAANAALQANIQKLHDSEARLAGVIGSAMDAIITTDAAQHIVLFNAAAERVFRCPATEVIGQPLERFIPERFRKAHAEHMHTFSQTGITRRTLETPGVLSALRADGEEFPIEATISQVDTAGQKFYTIILRDVTERQRLEAQLRQYTEELEAQVVARTRHIQELQERRLAIEKLAATAQLAAGVAHEINNPLAGIKNAFLLLKDAIPPDYQYFDYVALIEGEIERLSQIVRQMYQLYQPAAHKAQRFDLSIVVREVCQMLEGRIRRRQLRIHTTFPPHFPQVYLPRGEVIQVVYNLLQNAIHASHTQGIILIHAQQAGDDIRLMVTDFGEGIRPEVLPHIFEPFFTTKQEGGQGMGLGLAVSHSLVTAMGGRIEVETTVGQWTTFTLVLPSTADHPC